MKRFMFAIALALVATTAQADEFVNGYYRQNGTYVQPYHRTAPDGNPFNNYSTQGNVNPYTGQVGTHNPYAQPSTGFGGGFGSNPYGQTRNPYGLR